ncbi:nitroreductase family deazaflavin-dependent oxidoreductase [Streptomyces sp. NPDC051704]|uniref:nitroreductase family deazaflavin-dependent oxidoreductase n=1 Tax=Streptomyces sp. NPDC051704 TaxID=3365671 RepID=UPI00378E399F
MTARRRCRPGPPTGWRRVVARLPITLYRIGLGSVFGKRMLLLQHTGRLSGQTREVCLEVVAHDPLRGSWTVASGFGTAAQWYRNLRHMPKVTIQVGQTFCPVNAHFLTVEEGAEVMAAYASRHPRAARALCRYLGLDTQTDGTDPFREAGHRIPFVRLDEVPPRHWG